MTILKFHSLVILLYVTPIFISWSVCNCCMHVFIARCVCTAWIRCCKTLSVCLSVRPSHARR